MKAPKEIVVFHFKLSGSDSELIDFEQEKRQTGISHSPKTRTSGFAIPSQGTSPEVGGIKDNVPNRWFKPEADAPSSIRSIQIEEQAMKDFKRFYSNVRIVKPQVQWWPWPWQPSLKSYWSLLGSPSHFQWFNVHSNVQSVSPNTRFL